MNALEVLAYVGNRLSFPLSFFFYFLIYFFIISIIFSFTNERTSVAPGQDNVKLLHEALASGTSGDPKLKKSKKKIRKISVS